MLSIMITYKQFIINRLHKAYNSNNTLTLYLILIQQESPILKIFPDLALREKEMLIFRELFLKVK